MTAATTTLPATPTRAAQRRVARLFVLGVALPAALLAGTSAVSAAASAQTAPQAVTAGLLSTLRTASDARISPDGTTVVFLIGGEVSPAGVSESKAWLVATSGGEPRRLLAAAGDESEPRWSPDGRRLAYIADRGKSRQIYLTDAEGTAERPAGEATVGATQIAWSPDGRFISFQRRRQGPGGGKAAPDAPRVSSIEASAGALWILDVASGECRDISGTIRIASRSYAWSPDSTHIAVVAEPRDQIYTASERETLCILSLAGADPQVVANLHDRTIAVAWSPDGRTIGWCGREHTPGSGQLMVFAASGTSLEAGTTLAADFPGSLQWIGFLPDGHLAFAALVGLRVGLYSISIDGSGLTTVLAPDASRPGSLGSGSWGRFAISLTADGRHLATVRSGPAEPGNVVAGAWGQPLKRLTNINPEAEKLTLGAVEDISWKAADGTEIGGMLIKPVGYRPGHRYPTVVELHGGPRRSFWDTCTMTDGWGQMLAAHGYLVFQPNPRGSEGRGSAFIQGANRDLGGVDFTDVMAGVDSLVARGYADPERLGVAGWSYGGYLTAWTITQTTRFKAAVVGAGITNWISYTGLSGLAANMATYIWQQPLIAYENPEQLISRSPINFARRVKTATLILHGDRDTTVPTEQSVEFYTALRSLGVPVEHVLYPGEAHVFNRPAHESDVLSRVLGWFDKYLKAQEGKTSR